MSRPAGLTQFQTGRTPTINTQSITVSQKVVLSLPSEGVFHQLCHLAPAPFMLACALPFGNSNLLVPGFNIIRTLFST